MRTVLVYLLALAALAAAALFGLDGLTETTEAAPERSRGSSPPPVLVIEVATAPFEDVLSALGTVLANESVEVTPNRADHIAAIHFEDGQHVEAGHLLVEMQADEERAMLGEAEALRDEQRIRYRQQQELHADGMTPQRDLDNANALLQAAEARVLGLRAAIADREVRAPFAGTLGLRRVSEGAYVDPSTVITTLDDLSVVKLDFTIPEVWLPNVSAGMTIETTSDAYADTTFSGEITMVDTRLDPRSRSATVRARLPNRDERLRPGMLLKVRVERGQAPVLQVPEQALIPVGEQHFAFLVGDDEIARRTEVQIGRRRIGFVEILDGLGTGDHVVVEGITRVRDGTPVQVVEVLAPGKGI